MAGWNLEALHRPVAYDVLSDQDGVQGVLYPGEPFHARPSRVFAYLGVPDTARGPVPGVVCVHGGGGKAFPEWVKLWNQRGYAAISMDLGGCGPDGQRHGHAGPAQDHPAKFSVDLGWENIWTYHAVAAVVRAHSLLRSLPTVNPQQIAVTGISWGGYVTCCVAGVDHRFAAAIPVYGCGFLQDNSAEDWMKLFAKMTDAQRRRWHDWCDPSVYLPHASMPMLFVTGTNDFAYPLDSLKKSMALPQGSVAGCVRLRMDHGHEYGWNPVEIHRFTDHLFGRGPALPELKTMSRSGRRARASFTGELPVRRGLLLYTAENRRWQERLWHQVDAELTGSPTGGEVSGEMPPDATAWFLAVEDEAGGYASTVHDSVAGD